MDDSATIWNPPRRVRYFATSELELTLHGDRTRPFDMLGAVLSAVGMLLVVIGIMQAGSNLLLMTGLIFAAATVGILVSPLAAERLAGKRIQKTLILAGFVVTIAGIGLLIGVVSASDAIIAFVPGLLLIGLGLGVMLTPSVNVAAIRLPSAS